MLTAKEDPFIKRLWARRAALVATFLMLGLHSLAWGATGRYLAVADVHGDIDDFVAILQKTGVIDQTRHWTGGKATLVQLGDLIDRGPKPRDTMDLLIALEPESKAAGGKVVALLGNHEVMNVMGDLRYVTPVNLSTFGEPNSEERRKAAWDEFAKWRSTHPDLMGQLPPSFKASEEEWKSRHPLGFVEQRTAFAPDGVYGKWVRGHDAIVELGGFVYVHGGLDESVARMGIEAINAKVREEIRAFDSAKQYLVKQGWILPFFTLQEITAVVNAVLKMEHTQAGWKGEKLESTIEPFLHFSEWLVMREDSPLWFRGYNQWTDEQGAARMKNILEACRAKAIVVGHTPRKDGDIQPRFGGTVYLIDTGMVREEAAGGRASALEITDTGEIFADYLTGRVVLKSATVQSAN